MPRTNRQKVNEGTPEKEENPNVIDVVSIDEVLDDLYGGKRMSIKKLPANGIVPECLIVGCNENKASGFYLSYNPVHSKYGVYPFCKKCMVKFYDKIYSKWKNREHALWYTCQKFDIGFAETLLDILKKDKYHPFAAYMGQYNSKMTRSNFPTSFTSTKENLLKLSQVKRDEVDMLKEYDFETIDWDDEDRANRKDILRIYGYDVFGAYGLNDKKRMYNILVDYLDEATIADNFKKTAVVQIVKNMNYIEKIDTELIELDIIKNAQDLKRLTDAKNSLMNSNLSIAKDNGISLNHSSNKSKGAGTLSGILKDLQEKGIVESDVNIFDIATLGSIKEVADVSNQSILNQIMLDENSYTEMIKEQRDLIAEYKSKSEKLEEELRLLKLSNSN